MVHGFHIPEGWKVGCHSSGRWIFPASACKPYWLHQRGRAAGREGHEESQGTAEDPQEQPDTYGGEKQTRGSGVVKKNVIVTGGFFRGFLLGMAS